MSKLYLVGHRKFNAEKSMKNYLLRMNEASRKRTKVLIYTLETETTGDFIDSEIIQNKRDLQLKSLLEGSSLIPVMEAIKVKIEAARPKDRYYNWEGDVLLNKISIINDEKSLSDVVGNHGVFLFKLEKSIEWYKNLLRARSFQGIPSGVFRLIWDSNAKKYVEPPHEEESGYFKIAKEEIRNEKKGNKKTLSSSR